MFHELFTVRTGEGSWSRARPLRAAPPPPRRPALRAAALLASLLCLFGTLVSAAGAAPAAEGPGGAATIAPINFAIAVDESGSIQPPDMLQERDAASRIALGDVSAGSKVDIFGFASADDASQHPVDTVCPTLTLDSIGRAQVGACTAKLTIRAPGTGSDTDFPAAIRQGIAALRDTPAGTPRVLFILTDGKLDVSHSSAYGDEAHRAAEGVRRLALALDEARTAQVQIWPLGFGSDVDVATLQQMARGGYQQSCPGIPDTAPTAQDVHRSGDVGAALEQAFASAHCLHREPTSRGVYPPTTQTVHISAVATVGAIVVSKGDPAVAVTFTDPQGRQLKPDAPVSGTLDGSAYDLAGRGESVESLRLVDPVPGDWTVHLDAAEGHRGQLATVSVLWHGELRTSITLNPPNPRPGGTAVVTLQLLTRKDTLLTDLGHLPPMQVTAALVGSGFADQPLTLTDDGSAPDARAGDGAFTGTATIPATADGAIRATATLSAVGLTADPDRSEGGQVAVGPPAVSSRLVLAQRSVHPGESLHGTLELRNDSQQARTLAVSVRNTSGNLLTVDPSSVALPAGASQRVQVTVQVARTAAFEAAAVPTTTRLGGTLTVVDTSAGQPLAQEPLSVPITPVPGFLDEYGTALAVAAAALLGLVVVAVLAVRVRRLTHGAHGLHVELSLADGTGLSTLPAGRTGKGHWFQFKVTGTDGDHPTLVAGPGGGYAVRRDPRAGVMFRAAGTADQPLPLGRPVAVDTDQGRELQLSFTEGRAGRPPGAGGLLARLRRRPPGHSAPSVLQPQAAGSVGLDDDFDEFL
ncbi:choice-of-anchor X domain-containing protein [Kitasatospora sp. NPDC088346]|uniref:choice-of-anchor X domain-containing protein n=1 Tax=Kitasatospora sp. NPDC088346 TaxID=3364073 RepID=UPI00382045D1